MISQDPVQFAQYLSPVVSWFSKNLSVGREMFDYFIISTPALLVYAAKVKCNRPYNSTPLWLTDRLFRMSRFLGVLYTFIRRYRRIESRNTLSKSSSEIVR